MSNVSNEPDAFHDLGFFEGDDYLALPRDPVPWIIKGLIPVGGMVNLYGKPKTGKSFAALGIAQAVGGGYEYWLTDQFQVCKPGRVVYLQIDTPRGQWAARMDKLKGDGKGFPGVWFADTLLAPYPFNILVPEHQAWLERRLKAITPVMVVIDTLREVHNGDENDSTTMKNVVSAMVKACTPAAVLLVSHSRKANGMDEDLMNDARGSGYIAGRMDTVVKLTEKHLMFKGRAMGDGKVRVCQHPQTGAIQVDVTDSDQVVVMARLLARAHPKESALAVAKRLVEAVPGVSLSTARRRVAEARGEGDEGETQTPSEGEVKDAA